jgi:hypothetical protein
VKVIGIVQDKLPMYVFSIYIPFKGNQSLSIMRSNRCATNFVDYLRKFEAIFEKLSTCVSGAQGKLFYEKKTEAENLVSGSL